jgi:hypothetical protein
MQNRIPVTAVGDSLDTALKDLKKELSEREHILNRSRAHFGLPTNGLCPGTSYTVWLKRKNDGTLVGKGEDSTDPNKSYQSAFTKNKLDPNDAKYYSLLMLADIPDSSQIVIPPPETIRINQTYRNP